MKEKRDFCCMILCGYGAGEQAGAELCSHLEQNGIDAVLVTPCDDSRVRVSRRFWTHTVRMRYLELRHEYRNIVLIGISIGGLLQGHLADLDPAGAIFINSPTCDLTMPEFRRLFRYDLQPGVGLLRSPLGYYQFWRLLQDSRDCPVAGLRCPILVLQSQKDEICRADHADSLYRLLRTSSKSIRYYRSVGHSVMESSLAMAVCSDVFQFCSSLRGELK